MEQEKKGNNNMKRISMGIVIILLLTIAIPLIISIIDEKPSKDDNNQFLPGEITVFPIGEVNKEHSFQITEVGSISDSITFYINNTDRKYSGSYNAIIMGLAASNFFIDNILENKTIGPGDNITLDVYFRPVALGTHTASLIITAELNNSHNGNISNNGINSNNTTEKIINITGTAVRTFNYNLLPPSPPQPPVAVIAAFEGNCIRVTWVDQPGGKIPKSYNIYVSDSPEINTSNALKIENASKPYIHNNYTINETIYFAVTSENNVGEGRLSEIVSVRPGKAYYVSSINGNDSNNGTTPETAWKTLEKVNSHVFEPGEFILFEKGTEYFGRLEIRQSGTKDKRITFGAYGIGERPVISGIGPLPEWNNTDVWNYESENIWSINYGPWKTANRLWLSGEEILQAETIEKIDALHRWHSEYFPKEGNSTIYIYSEGNPAESFTEILEASASGNPMVFWKSDNITVSGIETRGGVNNIEIISSSNLFIEDCVIGNGSAMGLNVIGVWPGLTSEGNHSNNGTIKGTIIDSGFRFEYTYPNVQTQDGIILADNASGWKIYGNEIRDWGHAGIHLFQASYGLFVEENHIYSNYFTSEGISYGRAWGVGTGLIQESSGARFNHFYRNLVINTSVHSQIGGDYNYVYYNIIQNVKNSPAMPYPVGAGIVIVPGHGADYNKIFNNLIINTESMGIGIPDWHGEASTRYNEIYNNIVINCGWGAEERYLYAGIAVTYNAHDETPSTLEFNIIRNNIIYSDYSNISIHFRGKSMTVGEFNNMNGTLENIIMENYFFSLNISSESYEDYLYEMPFIMINEHFTVVDIFDYSTSALNYGK